MEIIAKIKFGEIFTHIGTHEEISVQPFEGNKLMRTGIVRSVSEIRIVESSYKQMNKLNNEEVRHGLYREITE